VLSFRLHSKNLEISVKFALPCFSILLSIFFGISAVNCASKSNNRQEEYNGIVATVNDEIITFYDLENRVQLVLLSIGGNVSQSTRAKIQSEVLNEMIDEKLKNQCIKKIMPRGGWLSRRELAETINNAIGEMAKQINKTPEQFLEFLKSKGIKSNTISSQIETGLGWIEYIKARFAKNINISESELNKICAAVKEKLTKESYYVYRMFLPIAKQSEEQNVAIHANNLINMLHNGADFTRVAKQFSKSADAKNGGELGWIFQGQLSQEEEDTLKKMAIESYSIVKSRRGYYILYLRDKRESGVRSITDLKIVQVIVPFREAKPPREIVDPLLDFINDLRKNSSNAETFIAKAKESGILIVSDPMLAVLESMQPQFRNTVANVSVNGFSKPIIIEGGILVLCVLDKKATALKEPSREDIKCQKTNEKLSLFAERELQDLRKKAVIVVDKKFTTK
jgi:peptidyl-prolyl cis-trans isomerase SurA